MLVTKCEGRSGGLAMFWRRGVDVSLRWKGRMHIDVNVVAEDGFKWRLTGIYGQPRQELRKETWSLLRTLHHRNNLPWMCVGDFNEILYSFEKQGGTTKPQSHMDNFRDTLDYCNLQDLGFEGDMFTWQNNNCRTEGYFHERLDRAVATPAWHLHFTDFKVKNGDPEHSDHRPVVVSVARSDKPAWTGNKGLNKRFEARWLMEEECEVLVKNAWGLAAARGEDNIADKLKIVSRKLHSWSRDVLGDLQNRIKSLKEDLEECREVTLMLRVFPRNNVSVSSWRDLRTNGICLGSRGRMPTG